MTNTRTFTPDEVTVDEHGHEHRSLVLKRACNGCGAYLGDVMDRDVDGHGNLTDIRGECDNCTRISPADLQVGDVITSDPRRDFTVRTLDRDEFGDVTINPGTSDKAFIHADQTVTIRPRRA